MATAVEVRNDVVFGTGGGRDLQCDVYRPTDAANAPAILLLHGGGWRAGHRSVMEGFGRGFAEAGFVAVASEYRLTPESAWPAQIDDVRTALGWMRANSTELGLDEAKLAILGRSAGGHLALLAAGTPGAVAAAIGIFPPIGFYPGEQRTRGATPARALLGDAPTDDEIRDASPIAHVTPHYPPTFLLHGTEDKVVPPSASMVMYESLVAAGVPVELHMYAGQPHGFVGDGGFTELCVAEIVHFLRRVLVDAPLAATAAGGDVR